METDNPTALLRALKGAPLAVLIAIRIFPGPATLLQLATATGYDTHTCSKATQALEAMGFVTRAHYRGWQLTTTAQQLPLWTPSELESDAPLALETCAPIAGGESALEDLKRENLTFQPQDDAPVQTDDREPKREIHALQIAGASGVGASIAQPKRENLALQPSRACGGSSSLINPLTREIKPLPLLHDAAEPKRENLTFQPSASPQPPPLEPPKRHAPAGARRQFQPDEEELLAELIDLTGCPRHRAEQAVAAARAEGYFTSWLRLQVLYWHAYMADGRGKNIQNPGYFVARKLEDGEACPFEDVRNGHKSQARELEYRLEDEQRAAEESASPQEAAA